MNAGDGLSRHNWIVAALLFGASLAMRVPFRSHLAYHWDSAQFALAVADYNPTRSLPQAPGYFLYVMLGKLVNLFVHDPHTSLVWISVVAGAALVALGYLLGTAMFGASCGWATAVILATSPLCWFQSEIALSYIVDAVLVTATVLVCWLAIQHQGGWWHVVALSALMALVAGVRQQSAPLLVPVYVYGLMGIARPRWRKFCAGVVVTALLCLAWFVPMLRMSGGISAYGAALEAKARFDVQLTPRRGGLAALLKNADRIAVMCWAGLLAAAVIATLLAVGWVLTLSHADRERFYRDHRRQLLLLGLWVLPMLSFWMSMYVVATGYMMNCFPGLAVAAGAVVGRVRRWTARAVWLLIIAGVGCAAFLYPNRAMTWLMLGLPLTSSELREHDRGLVAEIALIRRGFDPNSVVICHGCEHLYWGFRQFQYHLPEYRNLLLAPDASLAGEASTLFWLSQNGRTLFVDSTAILSNKVALLVVPPGMTVAIFARQFDVTGTEPVSDSGGMLYTLPAGANLITLSSGAAARR